MDVSGLPAINASLNAASGVLLTLAYLFIRRRLITAHKITMLCACAASLAFLACYLLYHFFHGSERFRGQGPVRTVYFTILLTHTILAAVNLPLILRTLYFSLKGDFGRHAKIARMTFPIWLYVSVTGVVVYWMLYRVSWQ